MKELDTQVNVGNVSTFGYTSEKPKQQALLKRLKDGFDRELFTAVRLPQADWAHTVFNPVAWDAKLEWLHVGLIDMAPTECRLLTGGKLYVLAVAYIVVPGANLREKRTCVIHANCDLLEVWLLKGGLVFCHESTTSVLVIPSKFLLVLAAGTEGVRGIRWICICDSAEMEKVRFGLKASFQSFLDLKSSQTGFSQYLALLEDDRD